MVPLYRCKGVQARARSIDDLVVNSFVVHQVFKQHRAGVCGDLATSSKICPDPRLFGCPLHAVVILCDSCTALTQCKEKRRR